MNAQFGNNILFVLGTRQYMEGEGQKDIKAQFLLCKEFIVQSVKKIDMYTTNSGFPGDSMVKNLPTMQEMCA